jgi:hypothetical protein
MTGSYGLAFIVNTIIGALALILSLVLLRCKNSLTEHRTRH